MATDARTLKRGWLIVALCCNQALRDRSPSGEPSNYASIDTCCIDKRSNAELSEAINSTYRWYRDTVICYTYLEDVTSLEDFTQSASWDRGWMLQELLAPATDVVFYGRYWSRLATRNENRNLIAGITRLHYEALMGGSLEEFNIATKMSWAALRRTTREEVRAYSLLGIFGLSMPLFYGEGQQIFQRLQEEFLRTTNDLTTFPWSSYETGVKVRARLSSSPSSLAALPDIHPSPATITTSSLSAFPNSVVAWIQWQHLLIIVQGVVTSNSEFQSICF